MQKLPAHLFAAESDYGALYDTRVANWSSSPPLRKGYRFTYETISNVEQLKATLRNGRYVWPGGYPLYFICADGESLSFEGVESNLRKVLGAFKTGATDWRVVGCAINWEDSDLTCAHTGARIESAYGDS